MWKRIDSPSDLPKPLHFVPIVLETPYGYKQITAMWAESSRKTVVWINAADHKQLSNNAIAWYEVPKYEQ